MRRGVQASAPVDVPSAILGLYKSVNGRRRCRIRLCRRRCRRRRCSKKPPPPCHVPRRYYGSWICRKWHFYPSYVDKRKFAPARYLQSLLHPLIHSSLFGTPSRTAYRGLNSSDLISGENRAKRSWFTCVSRRFERRHLHPSPSPSRPFLVEAAPLPLNWLDDALQG